MGVALHPPDRSGAVARASRDRGAVRAAIGFGVVCAAIAWASRVGTGAGDGVIAFWPLSGAVVGWMLAAPGPWRAPGALAAALVNGLFDALVQHRGLAPSIASAGSELAIAATTAALAHASPSLARPLRSPSAVFRFLCLLGTLPPLASTGVFVLGSVLGGGGMPRLGDLGAWWGSEVAGVLAVAPVAIDALRRSRGACDASRAEATAMFVVAAVAVGLVFGPVWDRLPAPLRHPHWLAPVLLWVGLRGGRVVSAAIVALVAFGVASLTERGFGPLTVAGASSVDVETQVFVWITAALVAFVAAMRDRESRLAAGLSRRGARLSRAVADSTRVATQLHTILDGMAETVVVCDVQGRVLLANEPALRGAGGERLRGGTFADYARAFRRYRADQRTPLEDHELPIARALRGESLHGELLWISPEGRPAQFVSCSARPIRDARGVIQSAVVVATDVSADVQVQMERERLVGELQRALAEIKVLRGVLAVCGYCHRIRDEHGAWVAFETYVTQRSDAKFSHGICPACDARVRGSARTGDPS